MSDNKINRILMADGTELDATALKYTGTSEKGNITIESPTDKNINLEPQKSLKIKPGSSGGKAGLIELLSDHTGNYKQVTVKALCGLSADGLTELTDERVIRLKLNTAEVELNLKGVTDADKVNNFNDAICVKFKDDNDWAQTKVDVRNIDICCHDHGGIALQPANTDSHNFMNKIKFESSLKVPVEHFTTYTIGPSTTTTLYMYTDDNWFVVGLVQANQAVQIMGMKILKGSLTSGCSVWNDGMREITDHGPDTLFGFTHSKYGDFEIGYSSTNSTTSIIKGKASGELASESLVGKYICIRRLGAEKMADSTRNALFVTASDSTKPTQWNNVSETSGNIKISNSQQGQGSRVNTPGKVSRSIYDAESQNYESQLILPEGNYVTIDGCTYLINSSNIVPVGTSYSFPRVESGLNTKFTITPLRDFHFESKGGDGIEWGTFNPIHTSLYSGDYRFKADAPIYAVTRDVVTRTASGKIDYPTLSDDTKDKIPVELIENPVTWGDIIKFVTWAKQNYQGPFTL